MNESNSYKRILKTTSIFGGVQVVGFIVSIIRSKFLAIFIGPVGYGYFGLLNSIVDLVKQFSGLGLEISGVKKIAESVDDKKELSKQTSILLKIAFLSGVLGIFISILFSKYLSWFTFGNYDKIIAIIIVSFSIFFKSITGSQQAIFQGTQKLNFLAKSNLYGNIIGLLIIIPLFYFYKVEAIVPSILIISIVNYIFSRYYFNKLNIEKTVIKTNTIFFEGKDIMHFGLLLSFTSFLPILVNYIIQIFINKTGGISEVGYFAVSMLILNSYVSIVFNAMSTEYYPRISSISTDNSKLKIALNQQVVLSILIIVPIIVLYVGFSDLFLKMFFSAKFLSAKKILDIAIYGMFFKSVSFCMGYIILAKADSKIFTKTAIGFSFLNLTLSIIGYHYYGLEGIGIVFLLYYFIHFLIVYVIIRNRYKISLLSETFKIFIIGFVICIISFLFNNFFVGLVQQVLFLILILITLLFSIIEINKRMSLIPFLEKIFKKND